MSKTTMAPMDAGAEASKKLADVQALFDSALDKDLDAAKEISLAVSKLAAHCDRRLADYQIRLRKLADLKRTIYQFSTGALSPDNQPQEETGRVIAQANGLDYDQIMEEMKALLQTSRPARPANKGEKRNNYAVVFPDGTRREYWQKWHSLEAVYKAIHGSAKGFVASEFERQYGIQVGRPFSANGQTYRLERLA